jgi:hypothetical protein
MTPQRAVWGREFELPIVHDLHVEERKGMCLGRKVNPLLIEASCETSGFEGVRVPPFAHFFWREFGLQGPFTAKNIDMQPANLPAISQTMGRSTTKTTEEHYGRISSDRAIDDIEKVWESSSAPLKSPKRNLPGYA